jgi:hypothetical protein
MELPGWRRAIALAFRACRLDTRAAQRGADGALPSDKPGLRAALRPRTNVNRRQGHFAHRLVVPGRMVRTRAATEHLNASPTLL